MKIKQVFENLNPIRRWEKWLVDQAIYHTCRSDQLRQTVENSICDRDFSDHVNLSHIADELSRHNCFRDAIADTLRGIDVHEYLDDSELTDAVVNQIKRRL